MLSGERPPRRVTSISRGLAEVLLALQLDFAA
jgi:hypothetical protein